MRWRSWRTSSAFNRLEEPQRGQLRQPLTATAEYRRRKGQIVFEELEKIPSWLGAPCGEASGSNLFHLFQPQKSMTGLFRVASAFLGYSSLGRCWVLATALWFEAVLGAAPGLAVIALLQAVRPWTGWALGLLIGVVGLLLGAVVGMLLRAARLPRNRFGLCTGYAEPRPGEPVTLIEWLNNRINSLAGHSSENPLTFGDLRREGVTLKMITTCLTLGRPYTMPFDTNEFYFSPDEMRLYFPKAVVDWMVQHAGKASERRENVDSNGFLSLPEADALPVIVATRMSLSFPVLFCAVPLYTVDWTQRRRAANETVPQKRVAGDALLQDEPRRPEVVWFSDGGICSNFPLHLFDSPLPRWPTFGLNLREMRADYSYDTREDHVWMPTSNIGGIAQEWKRWTGSAAR